MNVSKELLKRIAASSRLYLSDSDAERLLPQVKEILDAFAQLDKVDTKNVKPSFHPLEIKNVSRQDVPGKCLSQEDALSLTEHKRGAYFRGPKVV